MLSIEKIAVAEPAGRVSIADQFEQLGVDSKQARVYSRMYGFGEVPLAGVGEEFGLLEQAVAVLLARAGADPARVGLIVHAHTGPYIGPVGSSLPRQLTRRFGSHLLSFGMQLHKCVSSITALDVIDRLLAVRTPGTLAVLLIGEAADSKDLRVLEMGIAGDIGCAVLLDRHGTRNRVLARTVAVHGQYAGGIYQDVKAPSRRVYENNFQDHLEQVIRATLDKAGTKVGDLRYLLPHNVNTHIWQQAAQRLGIAPDRLYLDNVPRFAHCFGADVFMNLAAVQPDLHPGDRCLMASVGVGGTFGAVVLEH